MELVTEDRLATGGEAVARAPDGRVVFVVGAAPNERVRVEVTVDKKRFMRARVLEVLTSSPHRVKPRCSHYDVCGGCVLQHVEHSIQTKLKAESVVQTLARVGRVDIESVSILEPWSSAPYGYRTRARFAVAPGGVVGYRAQRSHSIVDVTECPILAAPLARALETLHDGTGASDQDVSAACNDTNALVDAPVEAPHVLSTKDTPTIDAHDGAGALRLSPNVFAQANREGNIALVEQVVAWAGSTEGRIVELYAGSGNFTRALAPLASTVIAIEGDGEAVALAREVKADNVDLVSIDVEVAELPTAEVLVLDPPRRGLTPVATKRAIEVGAGRVVYVSCDPATFARDVARFAEDGYRLDRLRVFDLYPQTAHVELVSLLLR